MTWESHQIVLEEIFLPKWKSNFPPGRITLFPFTLRWLKSSADSHWSLEPGALHTAHWCSVPGSVGQFWIGWRKKGRQWCDEMMMVNLTKWPFDWHILAYPGFFSFQEMIYFPWNDQLWAEKSPKAINLMKTLIGVSGGVWMKRRTKRDCNRFKIFLYSRSQRVAAFVSDTKANKNSAHMTRPILNCRLSQLLNHQFGRYVRVVEYHNGKMVRWVVMVMAGKNDPFHWKLYKLFITRHNLSHQA